MDEQEIVVISSGGSTLILWAALLSGCVALTVLIGTQVWQSHRDRKNWQREAKYEALIRLADAAASLEPWSLDTDDHKRQTIVSVVSAMTLVLAHTKDTAKEETLRNWVSEITTVMRGRGSGDAEKVQALRRELVDYLRGELKV